MRKPLLILTILFLAINTFGQTGSFHYIKFLHVGEQVMPVHPLNVIVGNGTAPTDPAEQLTDTAKTKSITTDEKSYGFLEDYIKDAGFKIVSTSGRLDFGTFKIIDDGARFYVPDVSVTDYLKKMIRYLKKKKADPQLIQAIWNNYPWI